MISKEDVYTQLHELISVNVQFHPKRPRIRKLSFIWKEKFYQFNRVLGYQEDTVGHTLIHMISVAGYGKCFILALYTKSLQWYIEEVYERFQLHVPKSPKPKQIERGITKIKSAYPKSQTNGISRKNKS